MIYPIMGEHFIGEEIKVKSGEYYPDLKSFEWRGKRFEVRRVTKVWQNYGIPGWLRRSRWWQRQHKNFYQIETTDGRVFEIYCDRGSRKRTWVLFKEMRA